jgi:MFS family permease
MDYLVRLNGAGREYTGIVGGTFQFVIMISSLIIGKATDHSRAYYSVILVMLVLGAFGLAECGVSLDADRGTDLRWMLIVVAALVGPLQPVSTELGVDVAYPLSENTVLVIQQLFSNLLSALFIPFFKTLKDVGNESIDDAELYERPEYTFSFYLLIVLHASATVFFATFNGRYLRYEHEEEKKAQSEAKMMFAGPTAFHPVHYTENYPHDSYEELGEASERGPESQSLLV